MWKSPTCVNHGWLKLGPQTQRQKTEQRKKQSQWQSWMQKRSSSSFLTSVPNSSAFSRKAAPASCSSSGLPASPPTARANCHISLTETSTCSSGNGPQSVRQTRTQRQLQNHSQISTQSPSSLTPASVLPSCSQFCASTAATADVNACLCLTSSLRARPDETSAWLRWPRWPPTGRQTYPQTSRQCTVQAQWQ